MHILGEDSLNISIVNLVKTHLLKFVQAQTTRAELRTEDAFQGMVGAVFLHALPQPEDISMILCWQLSIIVFPLYGNSVTIIRIMVIL